MGYYTRYSLSISTLVLPLTDERTAEIIVEAREASEDLRYVVNDSGRTEETGSWRDQDKDMLALSKQFKNVIFSLRGEGETAGDIWEKHFCNGDMQECRAVVKIPPLDKAGFTVVRGE